MTQSKPTGLGKEVAMATALVNYQDGSIVSREIVKKPTGSVTVFAFDEGQGLSEHTAPFEALVQVLEGEVEVTIAGKPHRVQGGEDPHARASTARPQGAEALQDDSNHDSVLNVNGESDSSMIKFEAEHRFYSGNYSWRSQRVVFWAIYDDYPAA